MKALDVLDELQTGIAQEGLYHELDTAIDEYFKKYVSTGINDTHMRSLPGLVTLEALSPRKSTTFARRI